MKIAYTFVASAFITGFNQSAVGLGDSDFPRRNLHSYDEFLKDTSFPRFSDTLQNKILHGAFPHQNEFLSKITSAYDKSRQIEKVEVVRQTQNGCTVCAYGEILPDPDRIFSLGPDLTFTCALFEEIAAEIEDCALTQTIGHTYCGCSYPPEGVCTFCADGESIPDPYKNVTIGEEMYYTCGEIALSSIQNDPDTCSAVQQFGYTNCGCPSPPGSLCSLCADGSQVSPEFLDRVIDGGYTCDWIQDYAINVPETRCSEVQFQGFAECGCPTGPDPVENSCSVCPEGFEPVPDLVVPEFGYKKCEDFVEAVSGISSDSYYCYEEIHTNAVTVGCCAGDKRCPDDDWQTFIIEGKRRPCSWLNTLPESMRYSVCNNYYQANEACPFACFGACYCRDKKWNKFNVKNGRKRSCMWLSRLKKKNMRNVCKWNKSAKKNCPDTCGGWCYFKESVFGPTDNGYY